MWKKLESLSHRIKRRDEVFFESREADVVTTNENTMRPRVYNQPTLWYLRVVIIQAQNLDLKPHSNKQVYIHAAVGSASKSTHLSKDRSNDPTWDDEEIPLVVAEPFNKPLILTVHDYIESGFSLETEILGQCVIRLGEVHKSVNDDVTSWSAPADWYTLTKRENSSNNSRLMARISLEGKYHVIDEYPSFLSDLRPSDKKLWQPPIGRLELSILNARGTNAMAATYCVARYGTIWARTRTIANNPAPNWNEQYSWDVYDPSTVIKIGVFENIAGIDGRIGKVRIRLSNLRTNKTYVDSYPLIALQRYGVKETGEIRLAIRFNCSSTGKLLSSYLQPKLLPMHCTQDRVNSSRLRKEATSILTEWLSQDKELSLGKDVVECMLDAGFDKYSYRKASANNLRVEAVFKGFVSATERFDQIRKWKKPTSTTLAHCILLILVNHPGIIVPGIFFYCFLIGLWNFKKNRDLRPPQMDKDLSYAHIPNAINVLNEEFDSSPSSQSRVVLRDRYDKLRNTAAYLDSLQVEIANKGEKLFCLLSWRDPRATFMVVCFCLLACILMLVVPYKVLFGVCGFYVMRHPVLRFGHDQNVLLCFFSRLPMKLDSMLSE